MSIMSTIQNLDVHSLKITSIVHLHESQIYPNSSGENIDDFFSAPDKKG